MLSARLQRLDDLVKELSFQDDPDRLIRAFARQSDLLVNHDGIVTVGCRDLEAPHYRVLRSWRWRASADPWAEPHLFPTFDRGLLGELLYRAQPALIAPLEVAVDDPAREHLEGMQALACAPAYEHGRAIYMVFACRRDGDGFRSEELETLLLNANLLVRTANNMLLAQQLQDAYHRIDHEMQQVGRMQHYLLPESLPEIDGLELGASYETCSRAGGDYYDVLPLPNGQWGLFMADVSGHGVPAAVVMAMLHTLVHAYPGSPAPPAQVMAHINRHLLSMAPEAMFATAFYGIYDPGSRHLRYAIAGHPPPRLRRGRAYVSAVQSTAGLPLGIEQDETWTEADVTLAPGDALLLYTDGIIEGTNVAGEQFGLARLDDALRLGPWRAGRLVQHIERRYRDFCLGSPDMDDRTLLAGVAVP
jgi:sigma-B regulation protein RsbU (phosphoserine phosphatase)